MERRIHLMRHSIPAGPFDNGLSEEGRALAAAAGRGLLAMGVTVDRILRSRFNRASETAEIAGAILGVAPDPAWEELGDGIVGAPAEVVAARVDREVSAGSILIVGHSPGLTYLARRWAPLDDEVQFERGTVACLVFPGASFDGQGRVEWVRSAAELRAIGVAAGGGAGGLDRESM